jgi:uncharacterized protein YnzC (UPF0291/DUF896 family)
MTVYAMAVTGRYGLGHGMLSWARSVVWAKNHGVEVIAPNWLQLRIGPYLRNERDKRFYYKLFQAGAQIGGARRLYLLATAKRVRIEDLTETEFAERQKSREAFIVMFHNVNANNEATYFHEIAGHSRLLRVSLLEMTRPRYRPSVAETPHIGVHIRGGDFGKPASAEELRSGKHNMRLPVEWYVEMITALREGAGFIAPTTVYSDCREDEIQPVLSLAKVTRSRYRESVTDMLAMSEASVLISSGSGFSRWGSYLGQVPRVCFPGQRGIRVIDPDGENEFEPEVLRQEEISPAFISTIRKKLNGSKSIL